MYRITQQIHFSYGHRLLDYEGKCAHLHGHNAVAELTLESDQLDSKGMIIDFSEIKERLKAWIENTIDHKMLLRKDDPFVPILKEMKEPVFTLDQNPTVEVVARLIFERAKDERLPVVEVKVWETPKQYAVYRD